MCGIAGFLGFSGDLVPIARQMADSLYHRGPDDVGVWLDESAGLALAHRRLAILDLSPAGHQPMHSAYGRYVIVFNGEIYNHLALRAELKVHGRAPVWRGRADTETLLAAFEAWGLEATLKKCVGMFAFALWDRRTRTLTLARDRLGEKPLYYGWQRDVLLFGSELKALKAHPAFEGRIDRGAVTLFLRHNYIPAPCSIYEGIQKLPPGNYWQLIAESGRSPDQSLRARGVLRCYWSARDAAERRTVGPFLGTEDEAREELERLLGQSVDGQMMADVPLGAFLSGGIDSSTVVALMQARSFRPVRTFTIGFQEQAYDEAAYAKAVAQHLGADHTELYVTPEEAMAVIPKLPMLYDEPFSDSSQIPMYLVAGLARRSVTVSLSGDGGDELFGGYNRYFLARSVWQRVGWLPQSLRQLVAYALTRLSPTTWDELFGGFSRRFPAIIRPRHFGEGLHKLAEILRAREPDSMYRRLVSHWEEPTEIVQSTREPPTALTNRALWPALADYTERMMYLDLITYLPDDILVKVDRASMGVSLESRVPLLDHRIIEFAWSLPLSLKIRDGQGKWLLREVLYKYLPKHLVARPKMGFGIPLDNWLRGPLRDWAESLLDEHNMRQAGYLDPKPIRRKWKEHLSGRRNWQYLLWDVLMFQAWHEQERAGRVTMTSQYRLASTT